MFFKFYLVSHLHRRLSMSQAASELNYLHESESNESGAESVQHETDISSVRTDTSLSTVQWNSPSNSRTDDGQGNNESDGDGDDTDAIELDDEWDEIEEWLRILFDAWNGRPLTGPERVVYVVIRRFLQG